MNLIICDECGSIDEVAESEKKAIAFADEHRRRNTGEHETFVIQVNDPKHDYFVNKVLEEINDLVDEGGSPAEVLREECDIRQVYVEREGEREE